MKYQTWKVKMFGNKKLKNCKKRYLPNYRAAQDNQKDWLKKG